MGVNHTYRWIQIPAKPSSTVVVGTFNASNSVGVSTKVTLGFKPVFLLVTSSSGTNLVCIYDERQSTTQYIQGQEGGCVWASISASYQNLQSINSDGFTMAPISWPNNCRYYAAKSFS